MDAPYMPAVKTANYIGGSWVSEPETMPAVNPATGETIANLPKSGRETAARAVAAAKAAAAGWAATPVFERAAVCVAIASAIDAQRDALARLLSLEQGKILAEATGEVDQPLSVGLLVFHIVCNSLVCLHYGTIHNSRQVAFGPVPAR